MYGFKYTIFFAMYLKHIFGQVCALKSTLIKLRISFFERKELRLYYIGVSGFLSHTFPTIFVLCLPCLYYAYYPCTIPTMPDYAHL